MFTVPNQQMPALAKQAIGAESRPGIWWFADDFHRANSASLGPSYLAGSGTFADLTILSNRAQCPGAFAYGNRVVGPDVTNATCQLADIVGGSVNDTIGVGCHWQSDGLCYLGQVICLSTTTYRAQIVRRSAAGSASSLGLITVGLGKAFPSTLRFDLNGFVATLWTDNVVRLQVLVSGNDSPGKVGLWGVGAGVSVGSLLVSGY